MWLHLLLVGLAGLTQASTGAPATDFGASAAVVGDVDGDGVLDVAVGAPHFQSNSVWVLSGADGRVLYRADAPSRSYLFGYSIARTPDLDGDGVPDLLVGAPRAEGRGAVHVLSGKTGEFLMTVKSRRQGDYLGHAVSWIGSLGEGESESNLWAVGAPQTAQRNPRSTHRGGGPTGPGYVEVFAGLNATPVRRFEGEQQGCGFGFSLAFDSSQGLGPFLVVGAPFYSGAEAPAIGYVALCPLSGGRKQRRLMGTAPELQFGYAVATNARVGRRASLQIAVGSSYGRYSDYRQGQVHLVGAVELTASWGVTSVAEERAFGAAVVFLDGGAEHEAGLVLAAAPMNRLICDAYHEMGTIALLSAATGARVGSIDATGDLCQHNLPGNKGDHGPLPFGSFLGDAGDWDGDGRSDLLIGSPDPFGGGEVWIYSPHKQELLARFREWEVLNYGPFAK